MRRELEEQICNACPNLFRGEAFSFEHGDGWFELMFHLSSLIEKEVVKIKRKAFILFPLRYIKHFFGWIKYNREMPGDKMTWSEYKHVYLEDAMSLPTPVQIKEKFSSLRYYMSWENGAISALIAEAEEISGETCENCGKPGRIRGKGWVYCRCDECWENLNKPRPA